MMTHTIDAIPGKRNTYARWIADEGSARPGDGNRYGQTFQMQSSAPTLALELYVVINQISGW